MRIAVDAMGGDHAPAAIIEGAINAVREFDCSVILVGDHEEMFSVLSRYQAVGLPITLHHASEVIRMDESPAQACRQKKDSSIIVATRLVKDGKADAIISAGNSGATMTAALMILGRLPGVLRPAIATAMPTLKGQCVIVDIGANVDCKAKHLYQFAVMGDIFSKHILGIAHPRVGLVSIGEEEGKGNELTLDAYALLKQQNLLNFIGNVEGGDIFRGSADVVVCDGFVGNIILKVGEGLSESLLRLIKSEITSRFIYKISGMILARAFRKVKKRVDAAEYGGAPLLGINGVSIVCHGSSNPKAIKNAIRAAMEFVTNRVNKIISDELIHHKAFHHADIGKSDDTQEVRLA
jgi:glycerol-3-phosphate acyltransferase PlsX